MERPKGYKGRRRGRPHIPDTRNYSGKHEGGCLMVLVPVGILAGGLAALLVLMVAWPWGVTP